MSAMSALASSAPPCAARRPSSATAATSRAPPPLRRHRDGRSSSSSSSSLSARAIPTPSTSSSSAPTTSANDDARTQADFDALWTWLEREGADVASVSPALVDATPGGRGWGLVATRDVGGGDAAIVVPRALWMTKETAFASKIGTALDPETTPPWCALALQLLHEKSLGDDSRWAAYIRCLPRVEALDAPLFWSSEELAELAGTQLLANAAGYDSYVRGTHAALKETTFKEHPALFGDAGDDDGGGAFSEREFLWAFGVLRSRALPPVDQGESIALIPGIDMANHDGLCSQTWQLNNGGIAAVFGGRGGADGGGSVLLRVEKTKAGGAKRGEEIRCNYGPANIDSQFALDYGFVDAFCSRPGYVLGPLSIPEDDVNAFDKMDVLSVAGLKESPAFTIRAFEDPPPEMVVFMRLLNLKNDDAFLLEAIFRQECWALISDPVSRDNEADACVTMLRGCEEALGAYATKIEDDRGVADDADASPRLRLAARVRMGEKQALEEVLGYYASVEARLDRTEYYQERRLRSLNLLDRDGNSTYDPFQDTMA